MERDIVHERLIGYPGSKGGNGVWQRIISEIPEHRTFIEGFAGGAAIWRKMRPSEQSWLIDLDPEVIDSWREVAGHIAIQGDALELIAAAASHSSARRSQGPRSSHCRARGASVNCWPSSLLDAITAERTVLYLDPPYLDGARAGEHYRFEMGDSISHRAMLRGVRSLSCKVIVSGYWSQLYADELDGWRTVRFPAMTHGGIREEWLWLNFPKPSKLHDARFVGVNFRDREKVKRRRQSWASMFRAMDAGTRQVVFEDLIAVWSDVSGSEASSR